VGGALLLEGRPFEAHEVFEDTWKAADGAERGLWRALAQVAVGLTHARRGNPRGAVTLLRRGAASLAGYASGEPGATARPYSIDTGYVAARAGGLADQIEREGLEHVSPDAFLLRLRP
jgi:hypothetical protein